MAASVPTTLGFALLGLVHIQPQTGYSLRKVFETTPMGHYSSSPGAIYPALKRLEQQGLIAGKTEAGDTLRPRRVYSATALGVDTLRKWVSEPVTRDELIWKKSELMLRFSFMGSLVDDSVTVRFLEQILKAVDDYLPELEAVLAGMAGDHPPHGRLALAAGIEGYRGLGRWARDAIEAFSPTVNGASHEHSALDHADPEGVAADRNSVRPVRDPVRRRRGRQRPVPDD